MTDNKILDICYDTENSTHVFTFLFSCLIFLNICLTFLFLLLNCPYLICLTHPGVDPYFIVLCMCDFFALDLEAILSKMAILT